MGLSTTSEVKRNKKEKTGTYSCKNEYSIPAPYWIDWRSVYVKCKMVARVQKCVSFKIWKKNLHSKVFLIFLDMRLDMRFLDIFWIRFFLDMRFLDMDMRLVCWFEISVEKLVQVEVRNFIREGSRKSDKNNPQEKLSIFACFENIFQWILINTQNFP